MTTPPLYSVDGLSVVLELLRPELEPDVKVYSRLPDHMTELVPNVLIHRTGGSSIAPWFYDNYLLNVQVRAGGPGVADPIYESFRIADQVRGILWDAVRYQRVVGAGWIVRMYEASGPQELPDSDQPLYALNTATYEVQARRPRAA